MIPVTMVAERVRSGEGPLLSTNHSHSNLDVSNLNISYQDFLLHFEHSRSQTAVINTAICDSGKETHMLMTVKRSVNPKHGRGLAFIALESCW